MVQRHRPAGLGLRVKDTDDGAGAYVGSVKPDSPAARAGIEPGDVIEELSGIPVRTVADLERIGARRRRGQATSVSVRRGDERRTLIVPA
ncbi:MAG: PDZ domain-containing protein [Chloroflexi bacterium]|nr:PDZ domain-containing protein [Chloroflexota bacterium]